MEGPWVVQEAVPRAAWFAASPFSRDRAPALREAGLRARVRLTAEDPESSAVVLIPQVRRAPAIRHAQEWVARREWRLRECRASLPDVLARLRAGLDSVTSRDLKKVQ